jgi:hypothetical protein
MHKTEAGMERKVLQKEALKLENEIKALGKVQQMSPAAKSRQMRQRGLRARLRP